MALLFLLLSLPARAYESDPQEFTLSDDVELFSRSQIDTDWVPSGSPIAVRFAVEADGGATVEMEGQANVSWPTDLNLAFSPAPGTGALAVDSSLSAVTSIQFDVFGYSWSSELDRRSLSVAGEALFDPFVMDGSATDRVEVTTEGEVNEVINYDLDVFTGVTLNFTAQLQPTGSAGFEGVAWWVDDGVLETADATLSIPAEGQPSQDITATFIGGWDSALDLTFTPTASVCVVIFGCVTLLEFDLPLSLASDDFEQAFPSLTMNFPLPALGENLPDVYDFGEVEVGQIANLEVPVANVGQLYLEGEAGLLGSPYFTVFPDYILGAPETEDGVVVTFAPETEGAVDGTLVITSNDPVQPELRISLTGTGVIPVEEEQEQGTKIISSEVGSCGCASGGRSAAAWAVFAAFGAALARRRGSAAGPSGKMDPCKTPFRSP